MVNEMEQLEDEVQKAFNEGFDIVRRSVNNADVRSLIEFFSDKYFVQSEKVIEGAEIKSYLVFSNQ